MKLSIILLWKRWFVQDVGTSGKQENDQVSTQGLFAFSRGVYNESNKSFNVGEDNVASPPNFKDMCWKETPLIGHSSWCKNDCDLLDLEGVFFARGHVMTFDLKEAILDDILGHDHVGLTILYCLWNISTVMVIWNGR